MKPVDTSSADIAIAGGGPVGLALACMLVRRGIAADRIALIDGRTAAAASQDPRSIALSWGSHTSNVTTMTGIFTGATSFNQSVAGWDTSHVTSFAYAFSGATLFDQDLHTWDVRSGTNLSAMLASVTLSTAHYDALLTAWAGQSVQSGVSFNAGNSTYSCAASDRAKLTGDPHNWTITDGGAGAACPKKTQRSTSGVHYGCKDPAALNYDYFSTNDSALCRYTQASVASSATSTPQLTTTLRLGQVNEEVRLLQKKLNALGFTVAKAGLGAPGSETSYFGARTAAAVRALQQAHAVEIMKPLGLTMPTGIVGERTRAYLNQQP